MGKDGSHGEPRDTRQGVAPTRAHATEKIVISAVVGVLVIVGIAVMFALRGRFDVGERVRLAAALSTLKRASSAEPAASAGPSASVIAVATQRPLAADEVEVCGHGIVKRADFDRPDFAAQLAAEMLIEHKRGGGQWVAAMRASPDEAVRAAAHYVSAALNWEPPSPSLLERVHACDGKADCLTHELREAMAGGTNGAREIEALIDEATTTTSPAVYAMAAQACRPWNDKPDRGRCQLVTLERWTQIDGDNFVPWMFRASAAEAQGDIAGRNEALYRASIASASRMGGEQLRALAEASLPEGAGPLDRLALHIELSGIAAAWVFPSLESMRHYCSADALTDANVHHVCDGLASALAERSETLIERGMGLSWAKQFGWPAERIEPLKQERDAATQVIFVPPAPEATDCAALEQQNDAFAARARLGEIADARQRIAASHQSVDALAKRYAEHMRVVAQASAKPYAEAVASAAAASAASAAEAAARH